MSEVLPLAQACDTCPLREIIDCDQAIVMRPTNNPQNQAFMPDTDVQRFSDERDVQVEIKTDQPIRRQSNTIRSDSNKTSSNIMAALEACDSHATKICESGLTFRLITATQKSHEKRRKYYLRQAMGGTVIDVQRPEKFKKRI